MITYSAAISACEKGKSPDEAMELLDGMRQKGLEPGVITCNAAFSACEKAKQSGKGLELPEETRRSHQCM